MAGVNKVILLGRLGADPEVKTIASGNSVANFNLATSENWVDKDGQKQERTEWHRVVVWGKLAELTKKYLSKGRQVYVEGRLQTRNWEDQQGQKRYTTEIVANTLQFVGAGNERDQQAGNNGGGGGGGRGGMNSEPDFGPEPDFDVSEEIPF